jgi:hypothetical protein
LLLKTIVVIELMVAMANAGMPAPLPTNWTKDHQPAWATSGSSSGSAESVLSDARLQGISFFIACLLLSAWGVQGLWQVLRKDLTWLPILTYRRSLSLVVLWGLLFVIVLTMISGARELMTPGAWRKQGWTYQLAEPGPTQIKVLDSRAERKQALEQLRLQLWRYAATHQGRFPAADDPTIDQALWNIPGWPGLKFIIAPDRTAEETGRLLVCEPELEGDERLVLLTNGLLGTMRTAEIRQGLEVEP